MLSGRLQRRGVDFLPLLGIGRVGVPEPLHHGAGEKIAVGEFVIGTGIEIRIGDRPEHDLAFERRASLVQGLERDGSGHVASYAVPDDAEPACVHMDFLAMCRDPFRGRMDFIDCRRILRLGRGRVVHKNRGESTVGDDVANEAFVRWEITENPSAAVDEDESGQNTAAARRPNDRKADL